MDSYGENFLGIDWGASDVGLAFSDAETRLAFGLSTIANDKKLLQNIGKIISEKGIGTIVIGIPSYVNRRDVLYEGEVLGKALAKLFPVGIAYQNEMFTTKMAEANLIERGVRRISRFDDMEAARIILQEWLDRPEQKEKK